MARPISILEISDEEHNELQRRVRASTTAKRYHIRAEIILLRSEALSQREVAERLDLNVVLVNRWCRRFEAEGLEGLNDQSGRSRKPTVPVEKIEKIVGEAGRARPGRGRWSTRTMAEEVGVSHTTVHRVWVRLF